MFYNTIWRFFYEHKFFSGIKCFKQNKFHVRDRIFVSVLFANRNHPTPLKLNGRSLIIM